MQYMDIKNKKVILNFSCTYKHFKRNNIQIRHSQAGKELIFLTKISADIFLKCSKLKFSSDRTNLKF